MTDADYVDYLAFFPNTLAQEESLQHSLELLAAGGISLYMNANKTEYMCLKQKGATFTLSDKPLKLVDQFTYLGNNISSTERDVNICLVKARNAIDRLLIIW